MKILSSDIQMASERSFVEVDQKSEELQMWVGKRPPSSNAPSSPPALGDIKDRVTLGLPPPVNHPRYGAGKSGDCKKCDDEDDASIIGQDLYILKKFIESLTGHKMKIFNMASLNGESTKADIPVEDMPQDTQRAQGNPAPREQGWGISYDSTQSHFEQEQTTVSAAGVIKTADGKEINFSLQLQMERQYSEESSESFRAGDAVQKVDPLVINFSGSAAQLTDMKFSFDLDTDGAEENISFVSPGSGFLVLDKNQDGIVNNGSELFGPATGNGFGELASYDEDGNNWIDENDSIYNKLSVWTKDDAGNDQLSSLKEKSVGAIYLSQIDSQFDLKNADNELQGQIAQTGLYADENGTVKTIQQVDLVV